MTAPGAGTGGVLGREVRVFLVVGVTTVLIDLACYRLLVAFGIATGIAKGISFTTGALFAYFANKAWTFRAQGSAASFAKFWGVYLATLVLNVLVNEAGVRLLGTSETGLLISFLVATGASATANFLGMKFVVFDSKAEGRLP